MEYYNMTLVERDQYNQFGEAWISKMEDSETREQQTAETHEQQRDNILQRQPQDDGNNDQVVEQQMGVGQLSGQQEENFVDEQGGIMFKLKEHDIF
jgi:hypothetical protein